MNQLLADLRIVEFSAFVAAPLGGMTMAQLGAEVIRIDPLRGGIDHNRWPVTASGASLYWAGLNKAKRSVSVGPRQAGGTRAGEGDRKRPRPGRRYRADQPAAAPRSRLFEPQGGARRRDHAAADRQPRRLGGGRLHGQRGERLPAGHRPPARRRRHAGQQCAAGLGRGDRAYLDRAARRRAAPHPHRPGSGGRRRARRRDAGDDRAPRLCRRRPGQRRLAPGARQRPLRQLRPRFRLRRRAR